MPSFLRNNFILRLTAPEHEQKCTSTIVALISRPVKRIVLKQQLSELPYKLDSGAMHLVYMSICSRIRLRLLLFWESFSACYIHSQQTGKLGLLFLPCKTKKILHQSTVQGNIYSTLPEYFIVLNQINLHVKKDTKGQR